MFLTGMVARMRKGEEAIRGIDSFIEKTEREKKTRTNEGDNKTKMLRTGKQVHIA